MIYLLCTADYPDCMLRTNLNIYTILYNININDVEIGMITGRNANYMTMLQHSYGPRIWEAVIQYADDTLIILPANQQELQIIKEIIDSYARATGLKINYAKSQLMPINVNAQKTLDLANALGCQVGEMPFTYLGLPLGRVIQHPLAE